MVTLIRVSEDAIDLERSMRQSLAGDKVAYAALLRETGRLLRNFLGTRLSFESEAEDVLQEILISIHKARHTYDGNRPYKPWMYAIAKFRLTDYLRVHYADQLRHAEEISNLENILAEDVTEPAISYESIIGEVRKLPERQATILQLMHHEGFRSYDVGVLIVF
jgi:RNA polymerase sigma-70 factor (ECF subfamily)